MTLFVNTDLICKHEKGLSKHEKGLSKHEKGLSKHEKGLSKHEKGLSEHEKGLSELNHTKMYREYITLEKGLMCFISIHSFFYIS